VSFQALAIALAVVSLVGNIIVVGVVLYVKSRLGPIIQRLNQHDVALEQRREAEIRVWKALTETQQDLANLQGQLKVETNR